MKNVKVFTDEKEANKYWMELRANGYGVCDIYIGTSFNIKTDCFEYTVFTA